ncbi:recombinase family protein [Pseudomonas ficuserectae]|uniref:recombinase family protein n=1 Tax=Pseudomonas ficuserectae TaxID=53410 RepID=UPI0006D60311|nr:recombinase family protein [Pseudomonas ficuserectae]
MPTAYAYVRFSTAQQGHAGRDSETRQTAPLEAFQKAFDLSIEPQNIVYDRGRSAFDGSNVVKGNLKELIEKLQDGDFLVVESIDRLTRQRVLVGVDMIQKLLMRGIKLYTTIDTKLYEVSDPSRDLETLLLISVIAKRANEESQTKSIRRKSAYKKAKDAAAESGKVFNKLSPPFGIRYDEAQQKFVEEPDEADDIRKIFKLLKDFGVDETCRRINQISTRRKWTNKAVFILIKNKMPLGTLAVFSRLKKDGKEKRIFERFIENYYPQIVSGFDFYFALKSIQERKRDRVAGRYTLNNFNIFKKVVFCQVCGSSMICTKTNVRSKTGNGGYTYLTCKDRIETGNCPAKRIRFEYAFGGLLELNEMTKLMKSNISGQEKNAYGTASLFQTLANYKEVDHRDRLEISEKIKAHSIAENQLSNLTTSLNYDEKIPAVLVKKLSALEDEIETLKKEIAILNETHDEHTALNASTIAEIIDIFKSEKGRISLNRFFMENKIAFKFELKEGRVLYASIFRKTDKGLIGVLTVAIGFPLRKPLQKFGLEDLKDIINLPPNYTDEQ